MCSVRSPGIRRDSRAGLHGGCRYTSQNSRSCMTLGFLEQPVDHAANGRDAGSCSDEHRILMRLPQREHAVRAMELDGRSFFQIAQPVGKESIFHAIQAEVETGISARGAERSNRPACDLCRPAFGCLNGNKLARNESEIASTPSTSNSRCLVCCESDRPTLKSGGKQSCAGPDTRTESACAGSAESQSLIIVLVSAHTRLDARRSRFAADLEKERAANMAALHKCSLRAYSTVTDFARLRG